eukprot:10285420-Alexandrium_andersonii.AAC.1
MPPLTFSGAPTSTPAGTPLVTAPALRSPMTDAAELVRSCGSARTLVGPWPAAPLRSLTPALGRWTQRPRPLPSSSGCSA